MAKLESLGILENTLVVVMSDHGEEFREHGRFIHSQIYEETVRVSLIFRWPSFLGAGGQSFEPVRLIDVMPTILELVGIVPEAPLQGRSLYPHLRQDEVEPEPVFIVGRDLASVIEWPWKLVRYGRNHEELFNLVDDPQEMVDRSLEELSKLRKLRELLSAWEVTSPSFQSTDLPLTKPVVEPSEKDFDRLEALGYLP